MHFCLWVQRLNRYICLNKWFTIHRCAAPAALWSSHGRCTTDISIVKRSWWLLPLVVLLPDIVDGVRLLVLVAVQSCMLLRCPINHLLAEFHESQLEALHLMGDPAGKEPPAARSINGGTLPRWFGHAGGPRRTPSLCYQDSVVTAAGNSAGRTTGAPRVWETRGVCDAVSYWL